MRFFHVFFFRTASHHFPTGSFFEILRYDLHGINLQISMGILPGQFGHSLGFHGTSPRVESNLQKDLKLRRI